MGMGALSAGWVPYTGCQTDPQVIVMYIAELFEISYISVFNELKQ
jgi:hypothetical protein